MKFIKRIVMFVPLVVLILISSIKWLLIGPDEHDIFCKITDKMMDWYNAD